jgi:hypothetical protein
MAHPTRRAATCWFALALVVRDAEHLAVVAVGRATMQNSPSASLGSAVLAHCEPPLTVDILCA